jgi:hypothetical protein
VDDQVSILGRSWDSLFTTASRPALRPTQPPIRWVPAIRSPSIKRPRREADHSPSSSAEVKNEWSYTSIPPYVSMAWRLKISRERKRRLYIYIYIYSDSVIKVFGIKYCKFVSNFIQEVKRLHYYRLIAKSDSKIKATWNIIKQDRGKMLVIEQMPSLLINDEK